MTRVKVYVTQKDIDTGRSAYCWKCPIELALERFPFILRTMVTSDELFIYTYSKKIFPYRIITSKKVQTFINRFDDEKSVNPFSFVINIPEDINEENNTN